MTHKPNVEAFVKLSDLQKLMDNAKSCFNCEHCDFDNSLCKKFESQPPMRIIRDGCPHFSQDIPF